MILNSGSNYIPNAREPDKYNNILSMQIYDLSGEMLAEYSNDNITKTRNANKQSHGQNESWIFTEKGFFLEITNMKH
jgi:hypothetical protein